jgi:hypothetical protein
VDSGDPPVLTRAPATAKGQSLAEFALVIPFLLVILLLVADFARFFAAAIQVESIARTAAEAAAWQLQDPRTSSLPADYTALHQVAWSSVCEEGQQLPNMTFNGAGVQCDDIATVVCVHDSADPDCSNAYNTFTGGDPTPAGCPSLQPGNRPTNAQEGSGEGAHRWVEVRVCYRFDTLFGFTIPVIGGAIPMLAGDFYIERTRTFTVADY